MKKIITTFLALALPIIVGCNNNNPNAAQAELGEPMIQGSNGQAYSLSCVQQNVGDIQANGTQAIQTCSVNVNGTSGERSQGELFAKSPNAGLSYGGYAYVYYPYVYSNTWNNPYSTSTYSYNSYGPYNDYTYANDPFCNWALGGSYPINCYYLFGYNNTNYSNYSNLYNPSCNVACLASAHPHWCENQCYNQLYY